MNSQPKIKVFFDIRGYESDVKEITSKLKIQPSEAWNMGEIIDPDPLINNPNVKYNGEIPRKRKFSVWKLNANLDEYSYDTEDYIKNIIKKLEPVKEQLNIFSENVIKRINIWVDIYPSSEESAPQFGLSVDTMKFLTEFNIGVDSDLSIIISEEF